MAFLKAGTTCDAEDVIKKHFCLKKFINFKLLACAKVLHNKKKMLRHFYVRNVHNAQKFLLNHQKNVSVPFFKLMQTSKNEQIFFNDVLINSGPVHKKKDFLAIFQRFTFRKKLYILDVCNRNSTKFCVFHYKKVQKTCFFWRCFAKIESEYALFDIQFSIIHQIKKTMWHINTKTIKKTGH
ncbi:hypothetical protein RFI_22922 [Reticulomyxa filosa]|uniref:Uncharacterized protein n=1 Tax=Reticulomyxa filosa TaxID=46433 RepID=X6MLZ3_RETFI|nr:hypothetical protein RFI_22922 [Reticulomyxa filosa]|eukprot:ETO14447.1 hypothetical protein RFI_22922 [Reticulomyxa filosa]